MVCLSLSHTFQLVTILNISETNIKIISLYWIVRLQHSQLNILWLLDCYHHCPTVVVWLGLGSKMTWFSLDYFGRFRNKVIFRVKITLSSLVLLSSFVLDSWSLLGRELWSLERRSSVSPIQRTNCPLTQTVVPLYITAVEGEWETAGQVEVIRKWGERHWTNDSLRPCVLRSNSATSVVQ